MSGLWKSDEELRAERWHEEVRSDLKKVVTQNSQDVQEATAQQVEAMARAARLQATATAEAISHQTSELLQATSDAAELMAGRVTRAIAEEWILHAQGKARRAAEFAYRYISSRSPISARSSPAPASSGRSTGGVRGLHQKPSRRGDLEAG